MSYEARILADSMAPCGKRLTTVLATYPRFVHAEILTHRTFSRNSASSRAIPVSKVIAQVEQHPATPIWWGRNQAGMQAREELDEAGYPMVLTMAEWERADVGELAASVARAHGGECRTYS